MFCDIFAVISFIRIFQRSNIPTGNLEDWVFSFLRFKSFIFTFIIGMYCRFKFTASKITVVVRE